MSVEQVFFNVPLSKLEPIFKRWIRDVQNESNQPDKVSESMPNNPFNGYIPRTEVVGKLATATTLWRWEKQGKLKSYGIGGKRFYKCSDIEQLFTEIKKGLNNGK